MRHLAWGVALATSTGMAQETTGITADTPAPGATREAPRRLGIAPIRWGGVLSYDVRKTSAEGEPDQLTHAQGVQVRAATYLWQPYIAQLSGSLGLTASQEDSNQLTSGNATGVSGGVALSMFPVSRYPFLASFDRSDSRASDTFTSSDYISTRMSLRQDYRPPDRSDNYAFNWDRSLLEGQAFGEDRVDSLSATFTRQMKYYNWDLSGNATQSDRSETGENSRFLRTTLRHAWRPENTLISVDSLASINDSQLKQSAAGRLTDSSTRFLQINSFATWRPEADSPLMVTGGARIFRSESNLLENESASQVVSANIGANYNLNSRTSLAGSATLSHIETDGVQSILGGLNGSISYAADPLKLGNYSYLWRANGNLSQQFSSVGSNQSAVGGGVGHSLSRDWTLSATSAVSALVNQDLSTNLSNDESSGNSQLLSHGASLSWRFNPGESSSAFLSVSASDSRSLGDQTASFQLLNLQANGLINLSRYAYANANLTFQWSNQESSTSGAGESSQNSAFGSLSYIHTRFMNVNRLRYTALLNLDTYNVNTRLQGTVTAARDPVSKSFEQRLEYRLGRLDLRLSALLAEIDGKKNAMLLLRIGREFGAM